MVRAAMVLLASLANDYEHQLDGTGTSNAHKSGVSSQACIPYPETRQPGICSVFHMLACGNLTLGGLAIGHLRPTTGQKRFGRAS